MRMKKTGLIVLVAWLWIVFAGLSSAEAQPNMSLWVGQWFKIKFKQKGYDFNGEKMSQDWDNIEYTYLNVWDWDPATGDLDVDLYYQPTYASDWIVTSDKLRFFTGTNLEFLATFDHASISTALTFLAKIEGKVKNVGLKSAKLEDLGGYYLEIDASSNIRRGLQITLTGDLIEASKVKVPPEVIIPHPNDHSPGMTLSMARGDRGKGPVIGRHPWAFS